MKLLITIDTEEDDAWAGRPEVTTENVTFCSRFQHLCDRFSFPPTWLCNEPVLRDPRLAQALGPAVAAGRAEIGAHLHPWNCPPFPGGVRPDPAEQFYATEIPESEFRAKMELVVAAAESAFGVPPASYRAGRWGFDGRQIRHLLDLGIRVDCSVTPHISWQQQLGMRNGKGGPDFRGAPRIPYWLDPEDVRRPGNSPMLELPLTVMFTGGPFRAVAPAWGLVDRLRYTPPGRVMHRMGWTARPFRAKHDTPFHELAAMTAQATQLGLPYIMLMFHSSELMPGGSPYNRTPESIEALYSLFERLFEHFGAHGIEGSTLTAFARPYFERPSAALRGAA
ncbi:MAG: hypothetical protein IPK72_10725 [Candidatus Eisenbacteria bacterium]|nr:hypothetical protein [Candidatus Eisenbacteria bacterium]